MPSWATAAVGVGGANDYGQLGNGAISGAHSTPAQIDSAKDWGRLSASGSYTVAIKTEGRGTMPKRW